jgi:hypothetical protein
MGTIPLAKIKFVNKVRNCYIFLLIPLWWTSSLEPERSEPHHIAALAPQKWCGSGSATLFLSIGLQRSEYFLLFLIFQNPAPQTLFESGSNQDPQPSYELTRCNLEQLFSSVRAGADTFVDIVAAEDPLLAHLSQAEVLEPPGHRHVTTIRTK